MPLQSQSITLTFAGQPLHDGIRKEACGITVALHAVDASSRPSQVGTYPEHPCLNVVQYHHPHSVVFEVAVGSDVEPVAYTDSSIANVSHKLVVTT